MTSRIRKDRGAPPDSEEQQLWQSVRNHLNLLQKLGVGSSQRLSSLEDTRRKFIKEQSSDRDDSPGVDEVSKEELNAAYRSLDKAYEDELREISKASEKLELLVAVRDDPNADASAKRKKRKTDLGANGNSSTSPPLLGTPAKERNISPVVAAREEVNPISSSLVAPTPDREKKRSNSKSSVAIGSGTPSLQRRATLTAKDGHLVSSVNPSTPSSASNNVKETNKDMPLASNVSNYVDPARARREVLAHQLPLQRGRKVAFRQPSKSKQGAGAANISSMTSRSASNATAAAAAASAASSQGVATHSGVTVPDDEGETWIMATITDCINNDRNRYVVQDAEDTAMPTYNTTLKAIVPLPESLTTMPLEDYKVGSQVMGLYPDTSCFYQAIVRGGGPGMNGKPITAKMQRRAEEILNTPYRLEFEDDGGAVQNVPACLVVERP